MSFMPQTSAYACTCNGCKRKILVEIPQFGISHIMAVVTTCWDCLDAQARERTNQAYRITEATFDEVEARRQEAVQRAAQRKP